MLADRLLGDEARPPRPAEDFSEHPLAVELDEICAANGFSRLDRLTRGELEQLVAALDTFEQRVSAQRKAVYDELDALTEELVVRYRVARGRPRTSGRCERGGASRRAAKTACWPTSAEFIRTQREIASMSVRRLAELAGVSNPYLSQIERGLAASVGGDPPAAGPTP